MKLLLSCLLLFTTSHAREITKVEGIGEFGEFGIRLLHNFLPQRGQRRIEEAEGSVEARFFQQQKLCPFGECDENRGLQLVYPATSSNQFQQGVGPAYQTSFTGGNQQFNSPASAPTHSLPQAPSPSHTLAPVPSSFHAVPPAPAPAKAYQTSFTSNGYNPVIDDIVAPVSVSGHGSFQPVASGQAAPAPVLLGSRSTTTRSPVYRPPAEVTSSEQDTRRADQPPTGPSGESECVCVPVAQCPTAAQAVFLGTKDYSGLISPRNPKGIIRSSSNSRRRYGARSIKFGSDDNELDENEATTEHKDIEESETETPVATETTEEEVESIVTEKIVTTEGEGTLEEATTESVIERTRRDTEELVISRGARLENVYIPDADYDNEPSTNTTPAPEVKSDDNAAPEDETEIIAEDDGEFTTIEPAYNIQSRDADIDIVSDLKQRLKEERRRNRKKNKKNKRKNLNKIEEVEIPEEVAEPAEYDYADEDVEDKSFDSIANIASDVTDKVGNVKNSVTSGVSNIFNGLTNLVSTKTSNGQLKPIVGVSFGLPQNAPGYGGYPNNPVNSGSATNPYYTAKDGIELGPVNFNPLFSLQAGTNDNGDLAVQPLVNLHLTPNGCGILGCKEYDEYGNPTVPRKIADALLNPIDTLKKPIDYLINKGQDLVETVSGGGEEYGYPANSGYGVPSTGYGAPSTGYGAPINSYGAPINSYGVPAVASFGTASNGYYASTDYAAPAPSYNAGGSSYGTQDGYGVPSVSNVPTYESDYTAPKPSYNAPSPSYSKPNYNAPKPSYNAPSTGYVSPSVSISGYNNADQFVPVDPPHHGHGHGHHGHESGQSAATVNIHHHYHHGKEEGGSSPYYRQEGDVNTLFGEKQNDDVFKRETVPNSSGALPANMPAKGTGAGFKFPGSRDFKLDAAGTRNKRQPLHLRDREPHSLEVDQAPNQVTNGMAAPRCGGPGSGFVCCRFN